MYVSSCSTPSFSSPSCSSPSFSRPANSAIPTQLYYLLYLPAWHQTWTSSQRCFSPVTAYILTYSPSLAYSFNFSISLVTKVKTFYHIDNMSDDTFTAVRVFWRKIKKSNLACVTQRTHHVFFAVTVTGVLKTTKSNKETKLLFSLSVEYIWESLFTKQRWWTNINRKNNYSTEKKRSKLTSNTGTRLAHNTLGKEKSKYSW